MAVVGGTAAVIGGGKFANGALAGAFMHMFNAEIGYRPLKFSKKIRVGVAGVGTALDRDNNVIGHQHIFFDDDGTNRGYGDTGMMRNENRSEYTHMQYYDDKILHQAVDNIGVWYASDYSTWNNHNCQDYVDAVVNEYYNLGGK